MAEWIYFIHPPRTGFIETITPEEAATMGVHRDHLERLHRDGTLIMAGPTFGEENTGIAIIEAQDEDAARRIMMSDPAIASGLMRPELRPMRVTFLRGRD
ncbi:MAG: YciI family protein [Marmoricola sp.]